MGGEPLCPENICQTGSIVCYIRDMFPDIKIFLWTGYTLEELKEYSFAREARAILDKIDVLIDGPYIEEQRDITLKLRGSSNQKIRKRGIDF
jgi:anaerobic ribonucleoside-triphosphate reductase activating protein